MKIRFKIELDENELKKAMGTGAKKKKYKDDVKCPKCKEWIDKDANQCPHCELIIKE